MLASAAAISSSLVAHPSAIVAWFAIAVAVTVRGSPATSVHASAWSTPSGAAPDAGLHAPPLATLTDAISGTRGAENSADAVPSALPMFMHVTVTVAVVSAAKSTLTTRPDMRHASRQLAFRMCCSDPQHSATDEEACAPHGTVDVPYAS